MIATGFFRDHIFRSINEQLRLNYYQIEQYPYSFIEPWIRDLSDDHLINLKFILTLLFSAIFLILAVFLVKVLFSEKKYQRYTVISYAGIFILSLIIYFSGRLMSSSDASYELSRQIMEFLQSPLLMMILIAAFLFDQRQHRKAG